jgi:hypothetical protein
VRGVSPLSTGFLNKRENVEEIVISEASARTAKKRQNILFLVLFLIKDIF